MYLHIDFTVKYCYKVSIHKQNKKKDFMETHTLPKQETVDTNDAALHDMYRQDGGVEALSPGDAKAYAELVAEQEAHYRQLGKVSTLPAAIEAPVHKSAEQDVDPAYAQAVSDNWRAPNS